MDKKYKGIICIIISAFCFALMNAFVRLSGDLPSIEKSFFRNLVAMFFAIAILIKEGGIFKWKKGNLPLLVLRSTCGTVGIICNYYAIDHLVLADASMLNKMSPFFVIIFSALFLSERIKPFQAISVIGAFIGSLFIIKPSFSNVDMFAAFVGLLGGLGAGAAYTCVRALGTKGENKALIVFFFSTFSCLVTLPYLIFDFHPMSLEQFIFLMLAGVAAAGGQFSITAAYSYAPGREISVYDYSQIIFAALLGFVLFNQVPDGLSILGYVTIIFFAVLMFVFNMRQEKIKKD